jgi:hypothetical protein
MAGVVPTAAAGVVPTAAGVVPTAAAMALPTAMALRQHLPLAKASNPASNQTSPAQGSVEARFPFIVYSTDRLKAEGLLL